MLKSLLHPEPMCKFNAPEIMPHSGFLIQSPFIMFHFSRLIKPGIGQTSSQVQQVVRSVKGANPEDILVWRRQTIFPTEARITCQVPSLGELKLAVILYPLLVGPDYRPFLTVSRTQAAHYGNEAA